MPSRTRRSRPTDQSAPATPDTSGPERRDAQDEIGNDAVSRSLGGGSGSIWDWFLGLFGWGRDEEEETPTLDAFEEAARDADDTRDLADLDDAVDEELAPAEADQAHEAIAESVFERSGEVENVELAGGSTYTVTAEDMASRDPWETIARNNGMKPELLQAFNQHVNQVNVGVDAAMTTPTDLAAGVDVYVPSAQEILFAQCRQQAKTYDEAVELYGELSQGPNVKMMDAARHRASGKVGEGYGTGGVDGGWFYTANSSLAGASSRRSETIGGQKEYKVFWVKDFWKCSLFMHDVVFQAGYEPHQTSNDHYLLAGRLHQSRSFTEVSYDEAMPGDCFQRFGGTQSDESHNAVLSDFPDIEDLGDGTVRVTYDIVGAESERAAEGTHESIVEKGSSKVVSGYGSGGHIRFLRPSKAQ